ncbi:MAG: pyrimidine 5'-nucleotidase, partial [Deltaproteobacteria bacterium]
MKAILFDLDNTLYPVECDLFSLIDVRINRYMEEVVEIDPTDVDELRRRYWQDYGATLQG